MDWRSVKFDWNRARAFLVTAEEGSLSAAARALGLTQPTLGRQVTALEEELGVALFERVGRGLELTPSGLELMEHVREMGEAAGRISLAASGRSQSIEGSVCITATEVASAFVLPEVLHLLHREAPGITVDVVASNNVSDLRRREADIAIRSARPTDPNLIARKLRDETAELYAASSYLSRIGWPQTNEGLSNARFIGFEENELFLQGLKSVGLDVSATNVPLKCSNHVVQWEFVKRGLGVGVMLSSVGDNEPLVEKAGPWLPPFSFEVYLVSHRELRMNRRVRLVFDVLASELGQSS